MSHSVFISYAHEDKPVADAVCARLEAGNIRCWIAPRDILPGQEWGDSIICAIESARVMVLIFSHGSNVSKQVLREVTAAVKNNVVVIPFRVEDVTPCKSMEYLLNVPHWLEAITPPFESHIDELRNTITGLLNPGISQSSVAGGGRTAKLQEKSRPWPALITSGAVLVGLAIFGVAYWSSRDGKIMPRPAESSGQPLPVNQSTESKSNAVQALLVLVKADCLRGLFDDAVRDATKALEIDPVNVPVLWLRADAYRSQNLFDYAIRDTTRALELDPTNSAALAIQAEAYRQQGLVDEALRDASLAIESDPNNAFALQTRADVYRALTRPVEALRDASGALALQPDRQKAGLIRAESLRIIAKVQDDVRVMTRAMAAVPGSAANLVQRADALLVLERNDEVVSDATKALALDPNVVSALLLRAEAYRRLNRPKDAKLDVARVLELQPNNQIAARISISIDKAERWSSRDGKKQSRPTETVATTQSPDRSLPGQSPADKMTSGNSSISTSQGDAAMTPGGSKKSSVEQARNWIVKMIEQKAADEVLSYLEKADKEKVDFYAAFGPMATIVRRPCLLYWCAGRFLAIAVTDDKTADLPRSGQYRGRVMDKALFTLPEEEKYELSDARVTSGPVNVRETFTRRIAYHRRVSSSIDKVRLFVITFNKEGESYSFSPSIKLEDSSGIYTFAVDELAKTARQAEFEGPPRLFLGLFEESGPPDKPERRRVSNVWSLEIITVDQVRGNRP